MSAEQPGYRGALPPRGERLARVWVVIVILGFAFMFVLAALNVPSTLFPDPTPSPIPSLGPAPSEASAPTGSPGASGSPAEAPSGSPLATGSPSSTP